MDILLDCPDLRDLGCEPVNALPHRIESGWSSRNGFVFRPASVGLPSYRGNDADEKRDQIPGEGQRG
jgi:hypothetical protein